MGIPVPVVYHGEKCSVASLTGWSYCPRCAGIHGYSKMKNSRDSRVERSSLPSSGFQLCLPAAVGYSLLGEAEAFFQFGQLAEQHRITGIPQALLSQQ